VWGKPLSDGGFAVVLLNTGTTTATVSAAIPGSWTVRDLWTHQYVGTDVSASLRPHAAALLKLTPR
jgi:alpha-galactosidase